jgi:hypothetical protein
LEPDSRALYIMSILNAPKLIPAVTKKTAAASASASLSRSSL